MQLIPTYSVSKGRFDWLEDSQIFFKTMQDIFMQTSSLNHLLNQGEIFVKSIKSKILVSMTVTIVVSLLLVGSISCILGYSGTKGTLDSSMSEMAELAADRISYELQIYKNIASEAGTRERLSNPGVSLDEKKELLQQTVEYYKLQRYNLLDTQGISLINGGDFSDRAYFKSAVQGETYVSEPLISSITGEVTIIVAAPIWQDGQIGGTVTGVVYFVPHETFLNDIMLSLDVSKNGSAYMLDSSGTTIAHKNLENVRNKENTIENAKSDKSLEKLAAIEAKMTKGEAGMGRYTYNDENKFIAYAPVPDTNGWSVAINAPVSDFTGSAIKAIIVTGAIMIAATLIASFIAIRLSVGIGKPIKACADRLRLLSKGDLDTAVPQFKSNDEVGDLINSTTIIVNGLSSILKDIDYVLGEMGHGNFVVDSQVPELYIGDFEPLLGSMKDIKSKLSNVLMQIRVSADQISAGAAQVSDGAQALAQGATEQASSVEELAATVTGISEEARDTAAVSKNSQKRAEDAGAQVTNSNNHMKEMTEAMAEIIESSEKISRIIVTIEDIAFQTNILALNAAVEAARAGSAGKGFAVVADEVRNLASKSDEAAKATKELIESSVQSVRRGSDIVSDVTESLQKTTDLAVLAVSDMEKVAGVVESEAEKIAQVTDGLDQISSVVQSNSATSEESAAASEELASQAQILKDMVGQFNLPSIDSDPF